MNLKFKCKFIFLKWRFKKIKKYSLLLKKISDEKIKYNKFFIKDEEDKILNKKVLESFDKKCQKYKLKVYYQKNKIEKLLYNLNLIDINYIEVEYKENFSEEDCLVLKEILKYKLINFK